MPETPRPSRRSNDKKFAELDRSLDRLGIPKLPNHSDAERAERAAARECAETLFDMARRIDSPSALGGYLSEKGVNAINATLSMLDVVTAAENDPAWREQLRLSLLGLVDRHLDADGARLDV